MPDQIAELEDIPFVGKDTDTGNPFLDLLANGAIGGQTDSLTKPLFAQVQGTSSFNFDYDVRTFYQTEYGVAVMPIAATSGPARPIRVHAPYMTKIIAWEVYRYGTYKERPVLPHWNTADPNDVLIRSLIICTAPKLQYGAVKMLWHCAGFYEYLCYAAMIDGDIRQVAALPIATLTAQQLNAQGYTFDQNILASYTQNVSGSPASAYSPTTAKVVDGENQGYATPTGLNAQIVG